MKIIEESKMTFGPFSEDNLFEIEKSKVYEAIQPGVKTVEFLWLRIDKNNLPVIWVVEAKKSFPNEDNSTPANKNKFSEYIDEIRQKFTDSLALCLALCLKRHPYSDSEFPISFKNLDLSTTKFQLFLVINGPPKDKLPPLQDALRKALTPTIKTWALGQNAVVVINEDDAQKYGLIAAQ